MVERLAGQGLRLLRARRLGLGVVDAVRVLHQRVEAAPVRPRAFVAVGAERHIDDAGAQLRRLARGRSRCPRPRPADSPARRYRRRASAPASVSRPLASRRSMKVESLPRPLSITSGIICGRCAAVTSSTSAPCAASVRPHTGPAITRVRSSTRTPDSGRSPGGSGCGGASPIFSIVNAGSAATARPWRMRVPFGERARHRDDQPGLGRGRLERLALPAVERALHRFARIVAAEQLQHAVAVMRKIGVQPHPAPVAAAVEPGDLVPQLLRRLRRSGACSARCETRLRHRAWRR